VRVRRAGGRAEAIAQGLRLQVPGPASRRAHRDCVASLDAATSMT
jgi:hypothetical protein